MTPTKPPPKGQQSARCGAATQLAVCGLAGSLLGLTNLPASGQECAYVGNQLIGSIRVLSIPDGGDRGVTTLPDCLGICQLTDIAVSTAAVYVTQFDGSRVWVWDPGATGDATPVALASSPTDLALSPDGSRLYVISLATSEAVTIDTTTRAETGRFALPSQPRGLALTPDGNRLVTTSRGQNAVFAVNASDGADPKMIEVGERPVALALSASGERAFVAAEDGTLTVVDLASGASIDTFTVGARPVAVAVHPNGETLYVANSGADTVSVITLASRDVTAVAVGRAPVALALTAGGLLIVANSQGESLSVIDTQNGNAILESIPAGVSPFALAVAPCPGGAAVCTGDCNGDAMVAINELIIGVNITLGLRDVSTCATFDANQNGSVEVSELIRAIRNSLGGCPS